MEQRELLSMSSKRQRRIRNYKHIFRVDDFEKTQHRHKGVHVIKTALVLCMSFVLCVSAKEKIISGKVIYIAAGSIYTSLGREAGVIDSLRMAVYGGSDTVAVIQVFALNSKSSVCRIIESKTQIRISDSVDAILPAAQPKALVPQMQHDTSTIGAKEREPSDVSAAMPHESAPFMKIRGRISLQYNAIMSDFSAQDFQQTGMVLNLHGEASGAPIKFEVYGNLRTSVRGNNELFSNGSSNDSRIYRMSVDYDDQTNILSVGRILLQYSSSLGYIDGISIARRFGNFTGGGSIGFEPSNSLQMPSSDDRKILLFARYQTMDNWRTTADVMYSRIWSDIGIEKEAFSGSFTMYCPAGFSIYTNAETELHTASQGNYNGDLALSLLLCSINYRISDVLTVGIGTDATRPVYTRSSTLLIPDSLLDKNLRTGVSFNFNLSLWRGAGLYNT